MESVLIPCYGKKKKYLDQAAESITRNVDIIYIVRKLLEVDKLK
jgi:hypothetical protein